MLYNTQRAPVFPASAGMNRPISWWATAWWRVPRERGDEPITGDDFNAVEGVFPASAGMNRCCNLCRIRSRCVPRERGDEPKQSNLCHS